MITKYNFKKFKKNKNKEGERGGIKLIKDIKEYYFGELNGRSTTELESARVNEQ